MPYTEFHYVPTGTGVISGKEVLEQTEDAINDLGGQISGDVQTAIDTANNAMNTANTANTNAQNAVNVANAANTTATNAQNTANTAQTTATNAQNAATAAQNDVDALENVVTGIEGRLTTTEGNVTNLTTRMGTAEGNITTLQNDVVTAQGTATSAQNTATLAREQAYVTRYTATSVSDNSTVAYSDLNNTDNIKIGDFILDVNGKLYAITAVDTANETAAVTTPLTQLAVDSSVMHLSGNESAAGNKNFEGLLTTIPDSSLWPSTTNTTDDITYLSSNTIHIEQKSSGKLTDLSGGAWNVVELGAGCFFFRINNGADIRYKNLSQNTLNRILVVSGANRFINDVIPNQDNTYNIGSSSLRWKTINNINPGALSFPNFSNGLDISGYLTPGNSDNAYTPLVDGFVSVSIGIASGGCAVFLSQGDMYNACYSATGAPNASGVTAYCMLPVRGGVQMNIGLKGSNNYINSAKFYPCQGNV